MLRGGCIMPGCCRCPASAAHGAAPASVSITSPELDGYLAIERRRAACGDPQHIWNKLLFDAANEALAAHYTQVGSVGSDRLNCTQQVCVGSAWWPCSGIHLANLPATRGPQAVRSLAGRLAPRVALLDPAMLDRHVTQRVLRWAALGGGSGVAGGMAAAGGSGSTGELSAMLAEDAAEVSGSSLNLLGHCACSEWWLLFAGCILV